MYIKKAKRVEILFCQHSLYLADLTSEYSGFHLPQFCLHRPRITILAIKELWRHFVWSCVIPIPWMHYYQLKIMLMIFQSCDHSDHNHSPSPVITIEYCHHQLPINWIWQTTKIVSKIASDQWNISLHATDGTRCQMDFRRICQMAKDGKAVTMWIWLEIFHPTLPSPNLPGPKVSWNPPWLKLKHGLFETSSSSIS